MGVQLVGAGATFRVWAPGAREVYVVRRDFDVSLPTGWRMNDGDRLVRDASGYWSGLFPGVRDGAQYRFWVVGAGGERFKRDPYARELMLNGYPDCVAQRPTLETTARPNGPGAVSAQHPASSMARRLKCGRAYCLGGHSTPANSLGNCFGSTG